MEHEYNRLINPKRFRPSEETRANLGLETESDRGRVLYSSPFRRLQMKTQVFPLEGNAAVRSRLTHSLEVAHIGRLIAEKVYSGMRPEERTERGLQDEGKQLAFINISETACLMHDIGNPPFGHFGEQAIKDWFNNNQNGLSLLSKCLENSNSDEGQ